MWRTTINGILARKLRLVLTALAVVLGVMFVAGSFVLTDTLKPAFTKIFTDYQTGNADVVVRAPGSVGIMTSGSVPESILQQIEQVEGVREVDGRVVGVVQLVTDEGTASAGAVNGRSVGFSWGPIDDLAGLELRDGRKPERDGEVAVDASTAASAGVEVGDRVRVVGLGPAEDFEVVGVFGLGDESGYAGATITAFDTATAQRLFQKGGLYDWVFVSVEPGESPEVVRDRIAVALGGYDVLTAEQLQASGADTVARFFDDFNRLLLIFAAIGVVVGFVIILNTFSILVTQRLREFGLLRAMGASTGQITFSVLAEAFVVGLVASGLGVVVGIGVARVLLWAFSRLAFELPSVGLVLETRTLWWSLAVGLGASLLASIVPAVRAARIPPVVAMSETNPVAAPRTMALRTAIGSLVALGGVVLAAVVLVSGVPERDVEQGVIGSMAGVVIAGVGVGFLSAVIARPLAGILGRRAVGVLMLAAAAVAAAFGAAWVARTDSGWAWVAGGAAALATVGLLAAGRSLLGLPGRLARSNAARNPRRTGLTALALMIGVSLVMVVAILAASIKGSIESAIETHLRADLVLTATDRSGFSTQVAGVVRAVPSVAAVAPLRSGQATIGDEPNVEVAGTDPATLPELADLGVRAGSIDGLAQGGVLLRESIADRQGLRAGDSVLIGLGRSGAQPFPVSGIFAHEIVGATGPISVFMDQGLFDALYGTQTDTQVWVKGRDGVPLATLRADVDAALAGPYPNVIVRTEAEYSAKQQEQIDQVLGGFYALLALAVVIALLGIVNTIFLSVYERTRELGLLRAVGMGRAQVRTMIRGEGVIIAVLGALLGVGVGGFGGWVLTRALRSEGLTDFVVPVDQVLIFVIVAAVAGVATAILPAWRAARLDVLDAIAVEYFTTGTKRDVPRARGDH